MRWHRFVALLAPILLSACLTTRQPVSSRSGGRNFLVTVWANAQCVDAGDTLLVRATVTNNNSETKVIELKERPVFDLYLGYRTLDGSTLIRWSDDKPLTPDLTRLVLKPGESKTIEMRWVVVQPAPSVVGATARFITDPTDVEHPVAPNIGVYGSDSCPGPFGP